MNMITRQNLDGSRVALFSDCGTYRYQLLIVWDRSKPLVANIGVNPSRANEYIDDATVNRDISRAALLGFGSLLKLNLFAIVSTNPKGMLRAVDPYGDWHDPALIIDSFNRHRAEMVIAAWGNHGVHQGRASEFRRIASRHGVPLHAYKITKINEPQHPLYLSTSAVPVPYQYFGGANG